MWCSIREMCASAWLRDRRSRAKYRFFSERCIRMWLSYLAIRDAQRPLYDILQMYVTLYPARDPLGMYIYCILDLWGCYNVDIPRLNVLVQSVGNAVEKQRLGKGAHVPWLWLGSEQARFSVPARRQTFGEGACRKVQKRGRMFWHP